VRNLNYFDPDSAILLYNGSPDKTLLDAFPFEMYGVHIHPDPKPMKWGWLHDFALDCFRYAMAHLPFDTMTIVDSDQLATGSGFTAQLEKALRENPRIGMFVNSPYRQEPRTVVPPAMTMYREAENWKTFLQQFPGGEQKFLYWSFWPTTVFTADAARDLVSLFDTNADLKRILSDTRIWASEEVLFPTLAALLNYELALLPGSQDFVKYKSYYTAAAGEQALQREDVFWMHPVQRRTNDLLRCRIREKSGNYSRLTTAVIPAVTPPPFADATAVAAIEGWLETEEAALLYHTAVAAIRKKNRPAVLAERGGWCGKASVVLAKAAHEHPGTQLTVIDPFNGLTGAAGNNLVQRAPTWNRFQKTIAASGFGDAVKVIRADSPGDWSEPIDVLFIDALHDYYNVARDFYTLEKQLAPDAVILFHDYAPYYPEVQLFVSELLASGNYETDALAGSMVVLRRASKKSTKKTVPKVSCIMPTRNRRRFIEAAIRNFLEQDYPEKELLILDDGTDPVADCIPDDPRVCYKAISKRLTVGEKRNLLCAEAQGEYILHWDDDDQRSPHWIGLLSQRLETSGADVTGLRVVHFFDTRNNDVWEYTYPENAKPWVHGGTMCYRKSVWEKQPFLHIDIGEDARFLWDKPEKYIAPARCGSDYLAYIHDSNISPKLTGTPLWKRISISSLNITPQDVVDRLRYPDNIPIRSSSQAN
jgi:predicted O-methyltransferase YrrM